MSLIGRLRAGFAKPYDEVDALEADRLVREGAVLLDVREPWEWRSGHAPRARHIPLGELARRLRELPPGTHVVVVCRSGNRSARASAALATAHDRSASNLRGGMRAWAAAGLPVVAKGGRPGSVV